MEELFALRTLSVVLIAAVVANDDFPSFGAVVFTFLAELATVVVAIVTEKFGRNFISAGNAKSVGTYIENLVVLLMVSASR